MSIIVNITNLVSASGSSLIASLNSPQGILSKPSGAAAGAVGGMSQPSAPSSITTGRAIGTGPTIRKTHKPVLSDGLTNISDPTSSSYQGSSVFPYSGQDFFTALTNDSGTIASAVDFNALSISIRGIEKYLSKILKAAPKDLAQRLSGIQTGQAVGISPNCQTLLGTTGGERYQNGDSSVLAPVRSPKIITIGSTITIAHGSWVAQAQSSTLSLNTGQKTALGLTSTVTALSGLSFFTGCKYQAPDATTFSSSDPVTWDSAALNGRVLARVDDNANIQLFLCPGAYVAQNTGYPQFFTKSPNNYPYLAPGVWYVWVTFVLSAYQWQ